MVQSEEWEGSANKIKLLVMEAPNDVVVVVLGASRSVQTLLLKSTHSGLPFWHLSLASAKTCIQYWLVWKVLFFLKVVQMLSVKL